MVRQHHPGIDVKRRPCADVSNGVAEGLDVVHEQVAVSVEQIDGEEVGAAGNAVAPVIRHRVVVVISVAWRGMGGVGGVGFGFTRRGALMGGAALTHPTGVMAGGPLIMRLVA